METLHSIMIVVSPGKWMASLDLKDACIDSVSSPQVPEIPLARTDLSVSGIAIQSVLGTTGLHQGAGTSHCMAQKAGD